jgi:hypothetical protein
MLMILFSTRRLSPLSLVITTLLVLLLLVERKKNGFRGGRNIWLPYLDLCGTFTKCCIQHNCVFMLINLHECAHKCVGMS